MKINKNEFELLLMSINSCYAKDVVGHLPKLEDFPKEIFQKTEVDLNLLLNIITNYSDFYVKSVTLRIIAIHELRNVRELKAKVDLKRIWKFILESILIIPTSATISSIGSQGFLSIPLFKDDRKKESFDFIRLHIWDNSLNEFINSEKCENFSIHTHTFYAKSWVLCGKVINDRFTINIVEKPTNHSLFTVGYNKSLNEVNQHTSKANNTSTFVNLNQVSHEIYSQGGTYTIDAGDFHKSGSKGRNGLSATLFSFTAKEGLVEQSYVVGPSKLTTSEINRKMLIDPIQLLKKIDKKFK